MLWQLGKKFILILHNFKLLLLGENCISLWLWIQWSSKPVFWPFRNFHHWIVTKFWFQLSQVPFPYLYLKKLQLSELQGLNWSRSEIDDFLQRSCTRTICWVSRCSICRILRAQCYLFCAGPFSSLLTVTFSLFWPRNISVSSHYTLLICQSDKQQ